MKPIYLLPLTCLALSACAVQPITAANPATIIYGANDAKIRNNIARACDEVQLHIEQQAGNSVSCVREAGAGTQMVYQYRNGPAVQMKYQFSWFDAGDGGIKVTGNAWYEAQNAFGAADRNSGPALAQSTQVILDKVKVRIEGKRK